LEINPLLVELSQNENRVLQALIQSGGPATPEEMARRTRLADSAIARAVFNLSQNGLVRERVEKRTELTLTEEGQAFANQGLPERRIVSIVIKGGGRLALKEALRRTGLEEKYASIATGWISRKRWGKIEKTDSDLQVVLETEPAIDEDEKVLARLKEGNVVLEELSLSWRDAAQRLVKRNAVEARVRNDREIEITTAGREAATLAPVQQEVSSLTGEMISSGEWETVKLRSYNVSSPVPQTFPGKYHPYLRFLRMVKRKLVALGFREAVGPLVETAFINCDCLYMPQNHPAREIHDLYYLKDPAKASLEQYGELVKRVAETHQNGWKTGSTGWRYNFSLDESSKLVLRSHGTALSVRTMISKDLNIPGKYFAIARCFRPDMLDRTHLTEFNQAEGIVLDPSLNLRNLLGILEMFAKEVAGAERVRFKPDYFPFTEPSVELQAYREGVGWMEFGGSGIFRPEVTEPLGVKVPVLAWGLGIDRLYMMSLKIQDIRQLFSSDLEWIRDQAVR
jgi:phenylalanyl-tRNA synthetase alpha chain